MCLLAVVLGSPLCFGAEPVPSIWGREILAQPFDKQPFREIRIPEWVQGTTGVGYTLSVKPREERERAVKHGVTISEVGFVDPFYAYYDSKLLKRRSPHVPLSRVDEEVAEYRRLGLRILAVYPPTLQGEVYELHPDWRRIATNTKEIPQVDLKQHPYGGMLCLLGPYGDFFIDVLAEVTEKYKVDAWSFDGLHYGGVCYCEHCRENFRKETGGEIPVVNLDDAAFRRYQHWADRRMEDVIRRMQTRLKEGIHPDVALVTWTTNAGRYGHYRDIPRNMPARMNLLLDAPDQEFWMDETNRGATIVPALGSAYIWACTNHRVAFSEPYLMSHGNPYGNESFPGHEIFRRMMLVATHGASPSLAVGHPKRLEEDSYAALAEVQKRKEWLTHKQPEPWGAMLLSDNTRVFYGRSSGQVEERYLASVFGTFRTIVEEHLPVTTICDWNLTAEDLSKYKVLILPNAACLSDSQCAAVREFVEKGGGLVASLDTSLCDEFGDVRCRERPPRRSEQGEFGLADVLGVQHAGVITADAKPEELDVNFAKGLGADYWDKRKSTFGLRLAIPTRRAGEDVTPRNATEGVPYSALDDARLAKLAGTDPLIFKGPAIRVRPADGVETLARLWPHGSPEQADSPPAIVTRSFGKGRVVYFAAGIDAGYFSYPYPYQRVLLASAIRWAAKEPPPLEVQAPMCVHATLFRQTKTGKDRLLVHLFNDVNTTANHALPNDDVPLREETLPIHDIRLTLRGYQIASATQQPEGKPLPLSSDGEGVTVTVPRLEVHSIIVLALPDSQSKH
jgi:hypothetical protein